MSIFRVRWSVLGAVLLAALVISGEGRAQTTYLIAQSNKVISKSSPSSPAPVTIAFINTPLAQALKKVANVANVRIHFATEVVAGTVMITDTLHRMTVSEALGRLLQGTSLSAVSTSSSDWTITRAISAPTEAQGTILGKVIRSETRQPIGGATISLDNASKGVTTGPDGTFRMSATVGEHTIHVRALGLARQSKKVIVTGEQAVMIEFILEPTSSVLDEVVVTGTVVATERKAIPNAITVVTAKDIEERGITRIDQLFRGDVPGLFSANTGAGIDQTMLDEVVMYSRGVTARSRSAGRTIFGGQVMNTTPIKTYVDGVELADPKYLSQIDPQSIERIEILTGPQASTIYGSNALNGVMQIFTKRGTTSRPEFTLNFLSGWIQNQFSTALAPQHDLNGQVSGIEGQLSYNAGGTWRRAGPWNPARQATHTSSFLGSQLAIPSTLGPITVDASFRRTGMTTRQNGNSYTKQDEYRRAGWFRVGLGNLGVHRVHEYSGQTVGLELNTTLFGIWSNTVGFGQDVSDTESRTTTPSFARPNDSLLSVTSSHADRRSARYRTTARASISTWGQATATLGADTWKSMGTSTSASALHLQGSLTGTPSFARTTGRNTGGFLTMEFGVRDQLFLSYGLRAEWNPDFGDEAQPNYAPRYGIAYTFNVGALTTKLRASYGKSTRPPQPRDKEGERFSAYGWGAEYVNAYGDFWYQLPNALLGPEYQKGAEGGLELYFGNRGSFVVTRYNQVVEDLIAYIEVDSTRSLVPFYYGNRGTDEEGYSYWMQFIYGNVGAIRNQGWELTGSINTGPFTTRGTYSWTKSRALGVASEYRHIESVVTQFQPGASYQNLPEHTWALSTTYAHAQTSLMFSINGVGQIRASFHSEFYWQNFAVERRLPHERSRVTEVPDWNLTKGYATANMTATHRFTRRAEGVLQVQNLTDHYTNDSRSTDPVIGRQTKIGFRLRL